MCSTCWAPLHSREHTVTSLREWAETYRQLGYAIVPIRPGQKRPTDKEWTRHSFAPHEFFEGCNIGIQSGRLSNDLVCIDIDSQDALQKADQFLPQTDLMEGRPGKPKSHRWYRVMNIPHDLVTVP